MSHASVSTHLIACLLPSVTHTGWKKRDKINFWNVIICFWVSEFKRWAQMDLELQAKWKNDFSALSLKAMWQGSRSKSRFSVDLLSSPSAVLGRVLRQAAGREETHHSWEKMAVAWVGHMPQHLWVRMNASVYDKINPNDQSSPFCKHLKNGLFQHRLLARSQWVFIFLRTLHMNFQQDHFMMLVKLTSNSLSWIFNAVLT